MSQPLTLATCPADTARLASDVQYYLQLTPRQLPSRYLYDALGSALFEAICQLPWYGVTRAESRLLLAHRDAILRHSGWPSRVLELGSGSGEKLRTLLQAPARTGRLSTHLVDVSAAALSSAARTLGEMGGVTVIAHEADYEDGLDLFAREPREPGGTLALFLGSNLGNFDRPGAESLIRSLRAALAASDRFLIGVDLVKPEADLLLAYDDPLGVTAAFNRNILVRLNRELDGDIDPHAFAHRAVWNAADSRVEMHLVSARRQRVHLERAGLQVDLDAGETVWTESSYKYSADEIVRLVERAGFHLEAQWIDAPDRFALTLFRAA
jgi:L-histidine N-alpha-methyltransferase